MREIQEVELKEDEIEAVRLADQKGLYRKDAAKKMKVSRQTFDRILHSARKKIAKALIGGMALKICEQSLKKSRKGKKKEFRSLRELSSA